MKIIKITKIVRGIVVLALLSSPAGIAAVSGVSVVNISSLEQIGESPRWMFEPKTKITGGSLVDAMVQAKKALIAKDRVRCLGALKKAYGLGKSLGPWLAWNQLQCAQLRDPNGKVSIDALNQAIAKLDAEPRWEMIGPAANSLKPAYVSALLILVEAQVKYDRNNAWKTLSKLDAVRNWLTAEERAGMYKWAGELSFIEQNLLAAQDFLQRSLSDKENAELRDRISSIRASLQTRPDRSSPGASSSQASGKDSKDGKGAKSTAANTNDNAKNGDIAKGKDKDAKDADMHIELPTKPMEDLGISDQEKEIFARMNVAYQSQDYVSALEDGVKLIQQFPGSRRALTATERVLDIYLSVAARRDPKYRNVHDSILRELLNVDSGRLQRWANAAYAAGLYEDAQTLAEKSYEKFNGNPESVKVLLLAGKSAAHCFEISAAIRHFGHLLAEDGGTPEALEATFRLGLLHYRTKNYAQAAAYFERLLALAGNHDYEYRALYWQWRVQQNLNPERSTQYANLLITKYPLSYYGLRAEAELNHNELVLKEAPFTLKTELHFMDSERLGWERLAILLKAGWLKESEKELEQLPPPQNIQERVVRAKLWALSLRYDLAIQNMNKVFDENPDWRLISLIKIVFPKEYSSWINRESKTLGLSDIWVRSLIRQESTFRPDAKSPSNALGLMQLLPATGQELATDLHLKNVQIPDSLMDPDVNIRLGSHYLARMIHDFNGNMPLALAAYNAGPSRLRRWLAARKDADAIESSHSSAPEVELWIDELPWDETSFYVKAVLRNWLIYRLMDGSKVTLSDPIWVDEKTTTR